MYDRFTDRARKVMQLANQEAQRFNHEYIGTEHVIIGLCKEGSGNGCQILRRNEIEPESVIVKTRKIVQPGPDMITMGKLPKTPRTKKVIEYAMEDARGFEHNYVGTEHILLGLTKEREGVAAQVLSDNFGFSYERAIESFKKMFMIEEQQQKDLETHVGVISGLTAEEKKVMQLVADAHNAFLKLPSEHPDELRDFIDGVHRIQDVMACRVVRRHYPKFWPTYEKE